MTRGHWELTDGVQHRDLGGVTGNIQRVVAAVHRLTSARHFLRVTQHHSTFLFRKNLREFSKCHFVLGTPGRMAPTSLHTSLHRRGNRRRLDDIRNDDIGGLGVAWPRLCVTDKGLTRPENRGLNKYILLTSEIDQLKLKAGERFKTDVIKCCELRLAQTFSRYKD